MLNAWSFFIEVITVPIYKRCDRCGKRLPAGTSVSAVRKGTSMKKYMLMIRSKAFTYPKSGEKKEST